MSAILLLVAKDSSQLHKIYQCQCTAKNSWWWAERLPETCRVVISIKLEFSASVGFIHEKFCVSHSGDYKVAVLWTVSPCGLTELNRHFGRLCRCNGGNILKHLLTNKFSSKQRHNYKSLKYMPPFPYPQYTSVCVISNYVHRTPLSFSLKYNETTYTHPIVRVDLQAVGCICVTYSFDAAWGNSEISDTSSRKWFTMNVSFISGASKYEKFEISK